MQTFAFEPKTFFKTMKLLNPTHANTPHHPLIPLLRKLEVFLFLRQISLFHIMIRKRMGVLIAGVVGGFGGFDWVGF